MTDSNNNENATFLVPFTRAELMRWRELVARFDHLDAKRAELWEGGGWISRQHDAADEAAAEAWDAIAKWAHDFERRAFDQAARLVELDPGEPCTCPECGGRELQARIGWVDLNSGQPTTDGAAVDWEAMSDPGFLAWCPACDLEVSPVRDADQADRADAPDPAAVDALLSDVLRRGGC